VYSEHLQGRLEASLRHGQAELEAGRTDLTRATNERDPAALETARSHFEAARRAFASTRTVLGDPGIRQARRVPILRGYSESVERSVAGLSDMGVALADAADAVVGLDAKLIQGDSPETAAVIRMIQVLQQAGPDIDSLRAALVRAREAARRIDLGTLPKEGRETVDRAQKSVANALDGLNELTALLPALLEIFGANGPRTYMIAQVNPAELRAGGGFIGSMSIVTVDHGILKLTRSLDAEYTDNDPRLVEGQKGYQPPPPPMREFLGDRSWVLGDSNWFPDYESNARQAELFAQGQLGLKLDGVISMDPQGIADMMSVTGPVTVPAYKVTVESKTFVDYLFELENGPNRSSDRKAFLGAVAEQLIGKISALQTGQWSSLLTAMNGSASRRDLQFYVNNQQAQAEVSRFGWSGSFNAVANSDFILELESNFGGTKANHFITRGYTVNLSRSQSGALHHKIIVDILDDATTQKPGARGLEDTSYRAYVRMYIPASATNANGANVFPVKYPNTDVPPQTKLIDGWIYIKHNDRVKSNTWHMIFEYDTPWKPDGSGNHHIYWQKQSGTKADAIKLTWTSDGANYGTTSDLGQDRMISLGQAGITVSAAKVATAHLPAISF
jgi:hypothetical protein